MPQIISANRLTDGIVVFRDRGNQWVEKVSGAQLFDNKEACAVALADAQGDVKACLVVDLAPVEVILDGGELRAAHIRNSIRLNGPTITPGEKLAAPAKSSPANELPHVQI